MRKSSFVKNEQNLTVFVKNVQIFTFLPIKPAYFVKTHQTLPFEQIFEHLRSKKRKIWTKNTKFWPNSLFLQRRCLTADLQSSITFWHGAIASFRKKWLFSGKRYFHMSQACKNDPGPSPLSPLSHRILQKMKLVLGHHLLRF